MFPFLTRSALRRPYISLFLSIFLLFSLTMFYGTAFTYVGDYAVYVACAQNLFHGGTLYQTAIDVKSTGFLFLFYGLIYYPYALFFTTIEFLHIWHAAIVTLWYCGLSALVYTILKPFHGKGAALFAAFVFQLFNLGNRHSLFFNQPQAALMPLLILVLVFTRTYTAQKFLHHFLYGVLVAFCFLCSSPYAILSLLVPLSAFRLYRTEKDFIRLALRGLCAFAGFILALAPVFGYFASRNALPEWWFWNYTFTTNHYNSFADLYILSGLQILPLVFLPFWSKTKHLIRRSLSAYFACFLIPLILIALLVPGIFRGDGFNQGTLLDAQASENIMLRLLVSPVGFPFKNILAKPLIVFISFFTGNDYLIFHTPPTLYHYFIIVSVLAATAAAFFRKRVPPYPLFLFGILTFCTRLLLSRGAGSDSWNLYMLPVWILWLPFLMETFKNTAFPEIQKIIFAAAYCVALVYLPIWNRASPERLTVYSDQVKAIVRANPEKTPLTLVFPWGFSYSTRWKTVYYNHYMGYTSTYEEKLASENPEALLMMHPPNFKNQARYLPSLTNYQRVSDDLYWLFIRKDALPSWNISKQ